MIPGHTGTKTVKKTTVSTRITAVGRELAAAFEELLKAIPSKPQKPQDIARALSIDKNVSHRLVTAIRKGDPLATASIIPGPEPLRRVTKSAIEQQVPSEIAERAEQAINAFESLISEEAGDRSGLEAIISSWLPDARERFEKFAKQSIYRGARQIKGIAADVSISSHVIHPSADPDRCDAVAVFGYQGLQRIRPGAKLNLAVMAGATNRDTRPHNLDRVPMEHGEDILWLEYCSEKEVELSVHTIPTNNDRLYDLRWNNAIGPSSTRNIIMRELVPRSLRRYRSPDGTQTKSAIGEGIAVPTKVLIFDAIIHEDVYPTWQPMIRTMGNGAHNPKNPNDPSKDRFAMNIAERVESLGRGIERFRAAEIKDYVEMLTKVCESQGWDPDAFRGYRTRIEYPVFDSEIQYVIDLPAAPGA